MFKLKTEVFDLPAMVEQAIAVLRDNEPDGGYFGCFSGGKDSVTIKTLADMSGVKVEWHYHKTTIDPPELVQFIKREHPDVIFDRSKRGNFFKYMVHRGFPTRRKKWCCAEYKEGHPARGDVLLMGIRAEESYKRAKQWGVVGKHWRHGNIVINPIFEWAADELWQFIRDHRVSYCELYDQGFHRLGCIGCPSAREAARRFEFARWPKFEAKWKRAFKQIWEKRTGTKQRDGRDWFGDVYFDGWEAMWDWWLRDISLPNQAQLELELFDTPKEPPEGWE